MGVVGERRKKWGGRKKKPGHNPSFLFFSPFTLSPSCAFFNQHILLLLLCKYLSNPDISLDLNCHYLSPSSPHFAPGLLDLYFDSLLSLVFSPFCSLQNCRVILHPNQARKIGLEFFCGSVSFRTMHSSYKAIHGQPVYLSRLSYFPSLSFLH